MRLDLLADMTRLRVAFRNYAKTPGNELFRDEIVCALRGGVKMLIGFRSG
jgi:hypothetical protein